MLNHLTSSQLSEWEAYDRLEPIGEFRGDHRIAMVCSLLVNISQTIWGKKGAHEPSKPSDFMVFASDYFPDDDEQESGTQSVEDMKKVLQSIVKDKPANVRRPNKRRRRTRR